MEHNESNFIYLKKTSMEKYYDELVKAEYLCEYYPMITRIIVRKVIEGFLKDIAQKNNIESNVSAKSLLNNINLSSRVSLPEEFYNNIKIILINGYDNIFRNNKNKRMSKHPIEILKIAQEILYFYLKITKELMETSISDLNFSAPSTIEYMEKEIIRIEEDIKLKNILINNLRQKIIQSDGNYKNISEINNIIISVKEEKSYLEEMKILLNKKIQIQKTQLLYMENNYKIYEKKFDELKKMFNENQKIILERESQLIKSEVQKQEIKILASELYEEDESINGIELLLEEKLKLIRSSYENLLNLTGEYQDILETIEFSYNKEFQKILEVQKNNIKIKINFEDTIFDKNIISYNKKIIEAKRKMIMFKGLLNDNIKKEIKYDKFYNGFLKLEGKEIKIIYTILNNVNLTFDLLGKPKELLSKFNEERFLESLNNNLEKLKNVEDNEMRLILYYRLIKLSKVSSGRILNRKRFVQILNNIVDKAYLILLTKKDFKDRRRKLDSISAYYIEKVIVYLKNRSNNLQITNDLIEKIYEVIIKLDENIENRKEEIFYEKVNLASMTEITLRSSIRAQPFMFLLMIVNLADITLYKDIFIIIFKIENLIEKRSLIKNFSNAYFMILLYLSSDVIGINKKYQEQLLPLLIMLITSIGLIKESTFNDLEIYNEMIKLFNNKKQKYNNMYIKREENKNNLDILIKEKQELETNQEELLRTHELLLQKYNDYKEEFKYIVMNSDKRILLPSYFYYDDLRSKKRIAEEHINESKNTFGTLKSMLSLDVWKEQASRLINESNIIEAEKLLIKEAKQKSYFKKEYSVFLELEDKIQQTVRLMNENKENIKSKSMLIKSIENKINQLQKQMDIMKDLYMDIEDAH